jgi:taurine dioxygenase
MIEIRPLTPTIGAEVFGIDLAQPSSPGTLADITKAFEDHRVLFFRDQGITTDQHVAFGRQFGELEQHPFTPTKPGHPDVQVILANEARRGNENTWHSDVTWRERPSLGSMLHAIEIPAVGGDTLFADMEAAYEGLDDTVRHRIDELEAVHDLTAVAATIIGEEAADQLAAQFPPQTHPVVRTHPSTGRRSIYVNAAFTTTATLSRWPAPRAVGSLG